MRVPEDTKVVGPLPTPLIPHQAENLLDYRLNHKRAADDA